MILQKIASYLLPVAITTATIVTPQTGVFPVGVGEQRIPDYLVAEYVPTVDYASVSPKTAIYEVFGADADIMWQVALCESGGQQFYENGDLVTGFTDPADTGIFQINKRYHLEESLKQGYDINTLYGNINYAKFLFTTQKLKPWSASSDCWSKQ